MKKSILAAGISFLLVFPGAAAEPRNIFNQQLSCLVIQPFQMQMLSFCDMQKSC